MTRDACVTDRTGTLAVDRAASEADIVPRADYLANRAHFDGMVDYVIVPTV